MIQGQLGNLEVMLNKLLDYGFNTPDGTPMVQKSVDSFLMDDTDGSFADDYSKKLIAKNSKVAGCILEPIFELVFCQQKEYGKAFVQEKAVYKRNPESFTTLSLWEIWQWKKKQFEDAKLILEFVLENTQDVELQMKAHHFLSFHGNGISNFKRLSLLI